MALKKARRMAGSVTTWGSASDSIAVPRSIVKPSLAWPSLARPEPYCDHAQIRHEETVVDRNKTPSRSQAGSPGSLQLWPEARSVDINHRTGL